MAIALESLWPLSGSVVVDGIAYVCAGRHSDADGGLFLLAVEPATGRVLWKENLRGLPPHRTDPHVKDIWRNRFSDKIGQYGSGTYNDVPISDGSTIFIGTLGLSIATRRATIDPPGSAIFGGPGPLLHDTTRPCDDRGGRNSWTFYTGRRMKSRSGGKTRPLTGSLLAVSGPQASSAGAAARPGPRSSQRPAACRPRMRSHRHTAGAPLPRPRTRASRRWS